jgi:hypothetical protein
VISAGRQEIGLPLIGATGNDTRPLNQDHPLYMATAFCKDFFYGDAKTMLPYLFPEIDLIYNIPDSPEEAPIKVTAREFDTYYASYCDTYHLPEIPPTFEVTCTWHDCLFPDPDSAVVSGFLSIRPASRGLEPPAFSSRITIWFARRREDYRIEKTHWGRLYDRIPFVWSEDGGS